MRGLFSLSSPPLRVDMAGPWDRLVRLRGRSRGRRRDLKIVWMGPELETYGIWKKGFEAEHPG